MEENRKNVEKALAKSLGVQTDRVKIIDIIEVKKGRRYLLGSTYVKIIYEVEVEDDTEAKSVEVNMKANEFKEILNANIKAQSPTLKATVETLEQPVTRRKKNVAKAEDGDNLVNTEDTQSHGPKGRGLWYWAELGLICICSICCLCGCVGLYYRRQAKQDPGVHRLRVSNDEVIAEAKDVTPRSRNTWDMTAIELSGVGKTQSYKYTKLCVCIKEVYFNFFRVYF